MSGKTFWSKVAVAVSTLTVTALISSLLGVVAISPSFGYGGGGSGSGGSGGSGGGSGKTSGTVNLSTVSSSGTQTVNTTAKVSGDGTVHKATVIKSASNEIAVEIPKDTKVTDKKGKTYTGTISVPKVVLPTAFPKPVPTGVSITRGFTVKTEGGVKFSSPVTIKVPLVNPTGNEKVWYYDDASGTWKIAGDGGVVADGMISVTLDHLTYFAIGTAAGATSVKGFTDVSGHWAQNYIKELSDAGVVSGKSDGIFQPNGFLTRAEAVKVVMGALGYKVDGTAKGAFGDAKGHWADNYVSTAKTLGIIKGYPDGSFRPNNFISRAEVLTMLLNAKGVSTASGAQAKFPDVAGGAWYSQAVNFAVGKGVVSGYEDGTFGPGNNVSRAEMAKMAVLVKGL